MNDLTHLGRLSIGPASGTKARRYTQCLYTFLSETSLFFLFLYIHRERTRCLKLSSHIEALPWQMSGETKNLLDFEGAAFWIRQFHQQTLLEENMWQGLTLSHLSFTTAFWIRGLVLQKRKLSLTNTQELLWEDRRAIGVGPGLSTGSQCPLQKTASSLRFRSRR